METTPPDQKAVVLHLPAAAVDHIATLRVHLYNITCELYIYYTDATWQVPTYTNTTHSNHLVFGEPRYYLRLWSIISISISN